MTKKIEIEVSDEQYSQLAGLSDDVSESSGTGYDMSELLAHWAVSRGDSRERRAKASAEAILSHGLEELAD